VSQKEFDLIEGETAVHVTGDRTESAALLAWFLHTVWRMEPEDVDDAICDGGGDKGIDALDVDDDLGEITIFQSKHRKTADAKQGDRDLKNLVGAAAFFETPESVDGLIRGKPNPELLHLLRRLKIRDKAAAGAHATRLVFVTNGTLDASGRGYIAALAGRQPVLDVWDSVRLAPVADRTRRPELRGDKVTLSSAMPPELVDLGGGVRMAIVLVPASELAALTGIEDLSLFDRNVRLGVGRTRINRELAKTVGDASEHRLFPAYHNGLTMLTNGLSVEKGELRLDGITVVNGCQSLLALYQHQGELTSKLRVLVKVVQLDAGGELTDKITYRTNNQNPVDIRDQRSTDPIQRDLQEQVKRSYGGELAYAIRAGEAVDKGIRVLDNQRAAQLLMAMYVGQPWNAVRKVRLFDEDYRDIFNREVDGHRVYFIALVDEVLDAVANKLRGDLRASFASVRVTMAHVLAQLLRQNEHGQQLLAAPQRWLPDLRGAVFDALKAQAESIVDLINSYIADQIKDRGDQFDPKIVFKNEQEIGKVERDVLNFSRRLAEKYPGYQFDVTPAR
jgi:hypothetical protein